MAGELAAEGMVVVQALEAVIKEARQAQKDLNQAVREAREEIRQSAKSEARKHLARQLRVAAEALSTKEA